jgi:hypothetical protein
MGGQEEVRCHDCFEIENLQRCAGSVLSSRLPGISATDQRMITPSSNYEPHSSGSFLKKQATTLYALGYRTKS